MARTDSNRYAFLEDNEGHKETYAPYSGKAPSQAQADSTDGGSEEPLSPLRLPEENYKPQTPWSGTNPASEPAPAKQDNGGRTFEKYYEALGEPDSDYEQYNKLVEKYLGKPMDAKEQARRERGATAAHAVGALGNVMSAFSNLAFTGGVAPSQKLPELPNVQEHIDNFRNRVERNRDAYIRAKMQTNAMKKQDYEHKLKRADLARKMANDENEYANKKALADARIQLQNAAREGQEEKTNYWRAKVNALEQGLPYDLAEKQARASYYNFRARGGSSSGGANLVSVQIADPVTGELRTIRVTGNKAAELLGAQEGDESNKTTTNSLDAYGGESSRTTERGKSAKQKSAEHTRRVREEQERKKKQAKGKDYSHTKGLGL